MKYTLMLLISLGLFCGCMKKPDQTAVFTFDDKGMTAVCNEERIAVDTLSQSGETDVLILTSYPTDGYDKLADFLTNNEVDKLYLPPKTDDILYDRIVLAAADSEVDIFTLQKDTMLTYDNMKVQLYAPADPLDGTNRYAVKVTHGESDVIYAPNLEDSEIEVLKTHFTDPCEVLRMPAAVHSTPLEGLLQVLTPVHAVFGQSGEELPTQRLLSVLENTNTNVVKTNGSTVQFVSDKKDVRLIAAK